MPDQAQSSNDKKKYDLEERTARFGEAVIEFVKTLSPGPVNTPLISQIVRAATSIGANYMEADEAESKRDFQHKISICRKESKETKHWLRMVARANSDRQDKCRTLLREAQELSLIFPSIPLPKKEFWHPSVSIPFVIRPLFVIWALNLGFCLASELCHLDSGIWHSFVLWVLHSRPGSGAAAWYRLAITDG